MLFKVYNQEGKEVEKMRLPSAIFGLKFSSDLVHQVAVSQASNQRKNIAHTKGRGEVRGGGKKPWKQKGTGRARVGSIRSPIWKGGGVIFGPTKERNFKKIIPKKMRRKALFQTLSLKAKENSLIILDKIELEKSKTKLMNQVLEKFPFENKSVLIVLAENDKKLILASRNIPKTETIQARDLNVLSLLSFKHVLMLKPSVKKIEEVFVKDKTGDIEDKKPIIKKEKPKEVKKKKTQKKETKKKVKTSKKE